MTALAAAGYRVHPGYGPEDAYPVVVEDLGTRCDHRPSDGTSRLPVECAGRIEPGETYVLVRHGFRLGMPVRLDCLLAAGDLGALPPCGHRDLTYGCGGCDPGVVVRGASSAEELTGAHAHEEGQ